MGPPTHFILEVIFTVTVMVFCFLVYYKTREVYNLTKHKGIQFFRYSFVLFGLAYASRLLLYAMMIQGMIIFEPFKRHHSMIIPVSNLLLAYFSTMAILYLIYSTIWKKFGTEHFITLSNVISICVAVVAFISRSPLMVCAIQLLLLIILVVLNIYNHNKKKTQTYALYFLIAIFWLASVGVIATHRILPTSIKIVLQIVSLGVFSYLYYRILKWVK